MTAESLKIRTARAKDAEDSAALTHHANGAISTAIYGLGEEKRALRVYRRLFRLKGNFFSYDITWIAELDGELVGIAAHLPVKSLRSAHGRMFASAALVLGPGYLADYNRLSSYVSDVSPPVPRQGNCYLARIAVAPTHRRQGIGSALLRAIHMRDSGNWSCNLYVEIESEASRSFFGSHGYDEVGRGRSRGDELRRLCGISGYVLMRRHGVTPWEYDPAIS